MVWLFEIFRGIFTYENSLGSYHLLAMQEGHLFASGAQFLGYSKGGGGAKLGGGAKF